MHTGTIVAVNQKRGTFSVRYEPDSWVVYELLSWSDFSVGDRVQGDPSAKGVHQLVHLETWEPFEVFIDQSASLSGKDEQLGLEP